MTRSERMGSPSASTGWIRSEMDSQVATNFASSNDSALPSWMLNEKPEVKGLTKRGMLWRIRGPKKSSTSTSPINSSFSLIGFPPNSNSVRTPSKSVSSAFISGRKSGSLGETCNSNERRFVFVRTTKELKNRFQYLKPIPNRPIVKGFASFVVPKGVKRANNSRPEKIRPS